MLRICEGTGKTIDDAIQNALAILGCDRDSVSVEVLEKPKSGFLGIGSTPAKVKVSLEISKADKASDFLIGLLAHMNTSARPVIEETAEGALDIKLEGENLGVLIGRRGETLNAIQHITNYVINRGEDDRSRVMVDIENYRKKREDSLQKLAEKTASKVMRYRRNIALEPMNAYERHVIHATLQEWKDVSTFSSGAEPRRCVVISYTPNGEKPKITERPAGRPGDRPQGDRPPFRSNNNNRGDHSDRPMGDRPQGDRPRSDRPYSGSRPQGSRPQGDRPQGSRPYGDRPQGDRRPYNSNNSRPRPPQDKPAAPAQPKEPLPEKTWE